MGDALTDIERDRTNSRNAHQIMELGKAYLLEPIQERRAALLEFMDNTPLYSGYWGGSLKGLVTETRKVLEMEDVREAKHTFIRLWKEEYHSVLAKELGALEE